jgi:Zn-dependent protease with chaperone function
VRYTAARVDVDYRAACVSGILGRSVSVPSPRRLARISPHAYEHPADRAATAALKAIPGLDAVVRKLIEFRYERAFRQGLMAASVRLGPGQLPHVWKRYENVLATLDMPGLYDLYLTQAPFANAAAVGSAHPMIIINSKALSLCDEDELETILAHEAGHILSEHVLYQTALMILLQLVPLGRVPALAGLPLVAIRSALLEWSRAAELSSDRAATLVNRDPLVTARTLMVLAAGIRSTQLDLDSFLRQGQEYRDWSSAWDRMSRLLNELNLTHSYPVRRVSELMDWVHSGEYDRIIGGDFPTRDQGADPRAEAGRAYDHYRDRFRKTFEEAGESIEKAADRMSDWLQGHR